MKRNGIKNTAEGKYIRCDLIIDFLRTAIMLPLYLIAGRNRVRILLYHKVCDLPPGRYQFHAVTPAQFDRQMEYLFKHRYNVITLRQFAELKEKNVVLPPKTVVITFDDGYMDNYANAFLILQKYGFRATFFIATDYIDSNKPFQWLDWDEQLLAQFEENKGDWLPLTGEMIFKISAGGHEIGSHTKSHPRLNQIEEKDVFEEIKGSKEYLEKLLSKPVTSFSYPYGEFSKKIKDMVSEAGYRAAVATGGSGSTLKSDFWALGRVVPERPDSLLRFKNKLRGAYDWDRYFRALLRLFSKRIKSSD